MHPLCPTIWHQGEWAFLEGKTEQDCPYPPNTEASAWWLDGLAKSKTNVHPKEKDIQLITHETEQR